ncbi:MAG: thioredoxin-disulfide reductase [Bacteroidales bacterium]|nr:thioredoxin-disulfide reductase [Bacteroidales bacterium]
MEEKVKSLILGSGPAGYTAAIYLSRAGLSPVLYEGILPGGQLTTTTIIENFPGFPDGIGGVELMERMKQQAIRFGTDVRYGVATKVDFITGPLHKVWIDNEKIIYANVVIIATGASAKYLGLPSEEKYKGKGVSVCATCDGFFYKNQNVAVVGGGDTACEEALYLSTICNKVYMIVRKNYLRASKIMQQKVFNNPKIEILFGYQTKEIVGNSEGVTGAILINETGKERKIEVSGFFVAIGHTPNTEIFKGQLDLDESGYIITKPGSTQTNIAGVFACGDVQDKVYRQAITAAASGCMAAIEAEKYLNLIN